jgi:two-component system osmolarity sensor histidine kinase EnvZ
MGGTAGKTGAARAFSIKAFLPRTLLGRSLLILIMPVLLIQVISTYMFFDRHWTKMTTRLAYAVAGEITAVADLVEESGNAARLQPLFESAAQHLSLNIRFTPHKTLDAEPRRDFMHAWDSLVTKTLQRELEAKLRRPFVLNIDFEEKWIQVSIGLKNGVLEVTLPGRRLFSSSGYIFLLWMIGTSMVLLVVAILFMRNQIRPIRKLAIAAERFGKGRDLASFRPSGAREVRQAAEAFIDMHKRIRRQIEQRTAMLAGVSHDLRTPLTRMKLQLAMMGDNADAAAMKDDILHMERMIGGYLDFVRGEGDEAVAYTSLGELIDKAAGAARQAGLSVVQDVPQDIFITVRKMAFERALTNLVNNAAKYAKHLWIEAAVLDEKLILFFDDDGPGVPEDQYEEVFRPFYRVDTSRNAETGGVGLGLPIVMDIIHGHGGKIWLEKSAHGGLRVCIRLPL